jgi:hypothetical protein
MRLNHNSLTGLLGRIALVSVMPVAHDRPLAQPMCSIPLTPSSSLADQKCSRTQKHRLMQCIWEEKDEGVGSPRRG